MTATTEQNPTTERQSPDNPGPNPPRAEQPGHRHGYVGRRGARSRTLRLGAVLVPPGPAPRNGEPDPLFLGAGAIAQPDPPQRRLTAQERRALALARDLARRGLSIEPHPMIEPDLEDLLRQAQYALAFPHRPGHGDPLCPGRSWPPARHTGPSQKVPAGPAITPAIPTKPSGGSTTGRPTAEPRLKPRRQAVRSKPL